jgi:hypothetical protein
MGLHRSFLRIISLIGIATWLIACGGGGGGDDDVITSLNGTWGGNLEDSIGTMHNITLFISGDTIRSVLVDGVDQGLTGSIVQGSANVFEVRLSDDTKASFIVDHARQHLTFVDEDFSVGVLQKDAGALPPFVQADIAGSGSGIVATTDFVTSQEFSGSVTCDAIGTCTGTDGNVGDFTATLTYTDLGRWTGTSNYAGGSSTVSVFLSVDKHFAGSWACNVIGGFPDDCSFSALSF